MYKQPAPRAVQMDPPRGTLMFPPPDPRAGQYEPGVVYLVPDEIPEDRAAALVDGGGFAWVDLAAVTAPAAPAQEGES